MDFHSNKGIGRSEEVHSVQSPESGTSKRKVEWPIGPGRMFYTVRDVLFLSVLFFWTEYYPFFKKFEFVSSGDYFNFSKGSSI